MRSLSNNTARKERRLYQVHLDRDRASMSPKKPQRFDGVINVGTLTDGRLHNANPTSLDITMQKISEAFRKEDDEYPASEGEEGTDRFRRRNSQPYEKAQMN